MRKIFKGSQTTWRRFLKPAVNVAAPFIGRAVAAKSKNPQVGQATKYFEIINRWKGLKPNGSPWQWIMIKRHVILFQLKFAKYMSSCINYDLVKKCKCKKI